MFFLILIFLTEIRKTNSNSNYFIRAIQIVYNISLQYWKDKNNTKQKALCQTIKFCIIQYNIFNSCFSKNSKQQKLIIPNNFRILILYNML
jgi:hypothetical protein